MALTRVEKLKLGLRYAWRPAYAKAKLEAARSIADKTAHHGLECVVNMGLVVWGVLTLLLHTARVFVHLVVQPVYKAMRGGDDAAWSELEKNMSQTDNTGDK